MKLSETIVVAAAVGAFCASGSADTLEVPSARFPTIQSGVDAAVDGDEVVVAPGIYSEVIFLDDKAITLRSSGGADVTTILGNDETVLSTFSFDGESDRVLRVEGFTIANGAASKVNAYQGGGFFAWGDGYDFAFDACHFVGNSAVRGGAMFLYTDRPITVSNCTFSNNIATGDEGNGGGAVRMTGPFSGFLTFVNCEFANNLAVGRGGALLIAGQTTTTLVGCTFIGNTCVLEHGGAIVARKDCLIQRCSFVDNTAATFGGALAKSGSSQMRIEQCEWSGNSAAIGGAVYAWNTDVVVTQTVFANNVAHEENGGAIRVGGGAPELILTDTTFLANVAETVGGGVSITTGTSMALLATRCRFQDNAASIGGGGVDVNMSDDGGVLSILSCEFFRNSAGRGAGLQVETGGSTDGVIANSVFYQNTATDIGGALYMSGVDTDASNYLANCTLVHNEAIDGGAIYHDATGGLSLDIANSILWDNDGDNEIGSSGGGVSVSYSDIDNSFEGVGNIKSPPQFVNAGLGDFRLLPDSPCIDSASNALTPLDSQDLDGDGDVTEPLPVDFAGLPRFVDDPAIDDCPFAEDCGDAPIVDMGAFERQVATGDLDGDGVVGPADLAIILGNWGPCADPSDCPADLDGDGVVGPIDLAVVLGNWG